MYKKAPDIYMI